MPAFFPTSRCALVPVPADACGIGECESRWGLPAGQDLLNGGQTGELKNAEGRKAIADSTDWWILVRPLRRTGAGGFAAAPFIFSPLLRSDFCLHGSRLGWWFKTLVWQPGMPDAISGWMHDIIIYGL